jgi:16S rRNA (adenine1518-N6/adenine1519-N6)-dimethyltransferase
MPAGMGHTPRKRFGQNFLRDDSIIEAIARAIAPTDVDHVLEIGPGEGALTQALITSGCRLDAIELDRDLRTRLLAAFSTHIGFTLHSADALQFDFVSLATDNARLRVVGNLPYNISTPLIFKLLDQSEVIADMHFMLQLEVVERLAASPGGKDWGRLGVMAQFQCMVELLFEVPPEAFYPPPKVQSAVVRLTPYSTSPFPDVERADLAQVVTQAFAQRRKTLRNNFKGVLTDADWGALQIDPSARAETLTIDDFISVTHRLIQTNG